MMFVFFVSCMQGQSGATGSAPFLVLSKKKKMVLLPLGILHKEAPETCDLSSLSEDSYVSTENEFPMEKWIHVGCEVWFISYLKISSFPRFCF